MHVLYPVTVQWHASADVFFGAAACERKRGEPPLLSIVTAKAIRPFFLIGFPKWD
jgi:hypothetical protein